jgi:hypothetical protein
MLIRSLLFSAALVAASSAGAQIGGSGTIQGTVTDPSGAVIPDATVVATNVATGVKTTRRTTAAGVYVLAPLAPGEYTVSVTADGFQPLVQERVVVNALTIVGLNLTLRVGAVTETITVSEAPPLLNTEDARLGTTMENEMYTALPLAMGGGTPRNPGAFIYLLPGVQSGDRWGRIMGGQGFSKDVYIEGIAITNSVQQGEGRNLSLGISVEAVEQFQMETAGAAVMYQGQGAENYVLKSGTNRFRGDLFHYFRNTVLDARGFFARERPQQNQNEFGFNIGGPIKKNRIFFFNSTDFYEFRVGTQPEFFSIPTLAQRNGDFSELPVPIYDPLTTNCASPPCTRSPFPGNVIPQHRISPISAFFQTELPMPTNNNLQNNYLGSVPVGFSNRNSTTKVDANLTDMHQVSVVFAHGKRGQSTPYRGNTLPLPYAVTRLVEEIPTTAQFKHTYVASPTVLNQFSFGFSRLYVPITNATVDGQWPIRAGLRGLPPGEADSSFPEVTFAGPNSPQGWRGTDARAFTEAMNTFTLQNNVKWIRGKHSFTFGYQMQRMQVNIAERALGSLAIFRFSNLQTSGFNPAGTLLANQGHAYASYLLGDLNSATVIEDHVVWTGGRFPTYAWWVQDDFKVTSRLTLNLGIRHDIMLPYREVADRMSFLNPDIPNPAASGRPGALQFAGFGENSCNCRTPIATHFGNFGPRVGLAYRLSDKTVMRASYGIMYSRRGAVGGRDGARNGTGLLGYSASPGFVSPDGGITPAFNWNNGVPDYDRPPFFDPTLNAGFTTDRPTAGSITFGDPVIGGRPPRYQNWNFGFQHSITSSMTLGIDYAGSNGHFLGGGGRGIWSNQIDPRYLALGNLLFAQATPANIAAARAIFPEVSLPFANFNGTIGQMLRPFPHYSGIGDPYGNVGNTNYNSMQITVQQRKYRGLVLNFNYTLSKQFDDTGGGRSQYNWGPEKRLGPADQTHVLNLTFVYDLPFGRGHALGAENAFVRAVASGWKLSGITTYRKGSPIGAIAAACQAPFTGACFANYNREFSGPVRINGRFGSGDLLGPAPPSFIERNAFANPAPFTFGDTPQTHAYGIRLPSMYNQDVSLRRDFQIREGLRFSLQGDAFNVFNNVIFGGINTNITSAAFGRVGSQANSPRVVQFGARLSF